MIRLVLGQRAIFREHSTVLSTGAPDKIRGAAEISFQRRAKGHRTVRKDFSTPCGRSK